MPTVRLIATPPNSPEQVVPGVPYVAQTMSASEPGTGTIWAEGGETIIGDVNRDGLLEHMRITGPSHADGGVELDVDPGSFVFSNSPKLRIKDAQILAQFTKTSDKKGLTPAQIARQYDVNSHVQTLKQAQPEAIAAQTAQYMLEQNLKKLAQLSLVQEQAKGFPSGVPLLAQQVLGEPGAGQGQDLPADPEQASFGEGGQTGARLNVPAADTTTLRVGAANGQVVNPVEETPISAQAPLPKVGQRLFLNGKPVKVSKVDVQALSANRQAPYVQLESGVSFTQADWQRLHSGKPLTFQNGVKQTGNREASGIGPGLAPQVYATQPGVLPARKFSGLELKQGDELRMGDQAYEVLNPHGEFTAGYESSAKSWRDVLDNTHGIVEARNKKTGQVEYLEGEDITTFRKNAPEYFSHVDAQLRRQQRAQSRDQKQAALIQRGVEQTQAHDAFWLQAESQPQPNLPEVQVVGHRPAPEAAKPATKVPPQVVKTQPRPSSAPARSIPRPAVQHVPASAPAPAATQGLPASVQSVFDLDD